MLMAVVGTLLAGIAMIRARSEVTVWAGPLYLAGFVLGSGEFPVPVSVARWPAAGGRGAAGGEARRQAVHEVDQLLDPAQQGRVEVVVRRDLAEDVLPGAGGVGLVAVRPAELLADALLPLDASAGTSGQRCRPSRSGFTAAQMSMNGWPTISTCLPTGDLAMPWAIRLSLEPAHQVVDEHADPALRAGPEVAQVVGEVVDAAEVLHDDALDAQVVAPDLLDQLGVVPALDEDPAGPGDPGLGAVDGDRAGRRTRRLRRAAAAHRRGQDDRPALEQEARTEREGAPLAAPVLQGERVQVAVDGDDLAAPVRGDLLDHGADLGGRLDGAAALGCAPVGGEDVGAVAVAGGHPTTVGGTHRQPPGRARRQSSESSVVGVVALLRRLAAGMSSSSGDFASSSSSGWASGLSSVGWRSSGSSSSLDAGAGLVLVLAHARGTYPAQISGNRFWLRGSCS